MARWLPGQQIHDRMQIQFGPATPPGVYTLFIGFWRGAERMPIEPPARSDGQGRLRAFTITVN